MTDDPDDFDDDALTAKRNAAAAAYERLTVVEKVVKELNSGYGNTSSSTWPYKNVLGASLVDSAFDANAMNIFGNVEISSAQQSPNGDHYDTQRNFRISREDAHQLAQQGPQDFRASFHRVAEALDKKFAQHAADFEAQRERLRIQGIADTVNQMSRLDRNIAAPKAARFTRRS